MHQSIREASYVGEYENPDKSQCWTAKTGCLGRQINRVASTRQRWGMKFGTANLDCLDVNKADNVW